MAFMAPIAAWAAANAGTISTALSAASATVSGVSAIQQGNYRAAVAKNNALIAEQNAVRASTAAQLEQGRSDREYAAALASQVAQAGASGLDSNSASFVRGRQLTRRTGRQAAVDIFNRGTTDARNLMQEAANFRGEASAARTQGYMNAVGAGLSAGAGIMHNKSLLSRNGGRKPGRARPNWWN